MKTLNKSLIPKWTFLARWTREISINDLRNVSFELIYNIIEENNIKNVDAIISDWSKEFKKTFWGEDRYSSMFQYSSRIKNFDRENFIVRNPEISNHVDWFCLQLKTRIALTMYPEKIDETVNILKENNLKTFKPWIFRKYWSESLKTWFTTHCRSKDWKVDWEYVHSLIIQQYKCDFSCEKKRPPLTKEYVIKTTREILDNSIEEKWYWHPYEDLEKTDKTLYIYITQLTEFRVEADRPDLKSRWLSHIKSRPNWFKISEYLWEKYKMTMRIWRWQWIKELEYRNLDWAIDELQDFLEKEWFPYWSSWLLHRKNRNLLNWFKAHLSDPKWNINWDKIVNLCSMEIKDKFTNNKKN